MRRFFAALTGGMLALAGFAGVAHPSATIDLIWDATGTNEINDSGAQVLQLNVILTAGPAGSQGASVSVVFDEIGEDALIVNVQGLDSDTPNNTPTEGRDSALPIEFELPLIRGSRVDLINSVCFCDLGIGVGLGAGEIHQLGYVTFNIAQLEVDRYEIRPVIDEIAGGMLDGNGNEILPADITFNSAFLDNDFAPGWRRPSKKSMRNR